ncbi:MAG: phage holin family protein [Bacteroidota bacterium]
MEKTSALVGKIYTDSNDYIRLQTQAVKLEIYERVTNVISSGINASLIMLFGLFSFFFVNVGLAFWLSEELGSTKAGFLSVGGIYFVVLGLYLLLKDKIAKNKVKNSILLQVSKTHSDFDLLLKEQEIVQLKIQKSEIQIKESFDELKENIQTLKDDIKKLKSNFVSDEKEEGEEKVSAPIPRFAITSIVDLILDKVVLRKSGIIKRTLLPILTNALLTSTIFKENKKTSLIENLKLKLPNILR